MDVSVVIPVYNRVGLIGRAIESVLRQQCSAKVEIVVVDDGSTDGTVAVLRGRYPEVRIVNRVHGGAAAARNAGIKEASHECLIFLDSDDELLPGSLTARRNAIEANTDIDLICCDFVSLKNGRRLEKTFFEEIQINQRVNGEAGLAGVTKVENFFDAQLLRPLTLTSAICVRRSAVADDELFDEELSVVEDWEFCLRFSLRHKVAILRETCVLRYLHAGNMINSVEQSLINAIKVDRKILSSYLLTRMQCRLMKCRLGDDLYEAGYFWWKRGFRRRAIRHGVESLAWSPGWKRLKLIVVCCLPFGGGD